MVKVIKIGEKKEAPSEEIDIETNVDGNDSRIARERLRIGIIEELQKDKQALRSSVLDEIHEDYKEKQKFVKRVYYSIILLIYLIFCYFMALNFISYMGEEYSLSLLVAYILFLGIFFPIAIISLGFTTGGILIGPMVASTYGLLSFISRFIIKIIGLDVELIFPELVGHVGVVSPPNMFGRYTHYNLLVEIEKAGLYGNSFWHGNKLAACSSEGEIPIGANVKVIEAEYWSLSSILRNSPVITVVQEV